MIFRGENIVGQFGAGCLPEFKTEGLKYDPDVVYAELLGCTRVIYGGETVYEKGPWCEDYYEMPIGSRHDSTPEARDIESDPELEDEEYQVAMNEEGDILFECPGCIVIVPSDGSSIKMIGDKCDEYLPDSNGTDVTNAASHDSISSRGPPVDPSDEYDDPLAKKIAKLPIIEVNDGCTWTLRGLKNDHVLVSCNNCLRLYNERAEIVTQSGCCDAKKIDDGKTEIGSRDDSDDDDTED